MEKTRNQEIEENQGVQDFQNPKKSDFGMKKIFRITSGRMVHLRIGVCYRASVSSWCEYSTFVLKIKTEKRLQESEENQRVWGFGQKWKLRNLVKSRGAMIACNRNPVGEKKENFQNYLCSYESPPVFCGWVELSSARGVSIAHLFQKPKLKSGCEKVRKTKGSETLTKIRK